jgi:hypothetical protein
VFTLPTEYRSTERHGSVNCTFNGLLSMLITSTITDPIEGFGVRIYEFK